MQDMISAEESVLSFKVQKASSKDENASRKLKDEEVFSIVMRSFCFELDILMPNSFCASNVQLSSSINS